MGKAILLLKFWQTMRICKSQIYLRKIMYTWYFFSGQQNGDIHQSMKLHNLEQIHYINPVFCFADCKEFPYLVLKSTVQNCKDPVGILFPVLGPCNLLTKRVVVQILEVTVNSLNTNNGQEIRKCWGISPEILLTPNSRLLLSVLSVVIMIMSSSSFFIFLDTNKLSKHIFLLR